jgi:hypothetical protein
LLSLSYCLVGAAFARTAAMLCYGSSIPTWLLLPWLLACLPLGFAIKILCTDLFRKYEAASMGARPMPVIKGKRFGNIDLMLNLLEHFKTGYPGMRQHVTLYRILKS